MNQYAQSMPARSSTSNRLPWRLAIIAAAIAVAGCAAPLAWQVDESATSAVEAGESQAAAPLITVPPSNIGTWFDLGHRRTRWLSGDAPVPVSGSKTPTRVAGLRSDQGYWAALVIVQQSTYGSADCPLPNSLNAADAIEAADPCLRLRRNADFDGWMQEQHPVFDDWIDQRHWAGTPRVWVSYRVPLENRLLEAHALLDPALLEPVTRNNTDFLEGGRPGLDWSLQFARAARAAAHGAALEVPPFPFASRLVGEQPAQADPEEQALPEVIPIQVEPQAERAPRQDRQ